MKYLLLLLPLTLLAQIPGTFRVTGPVAPSATNSNYGAAVPVYNYGGLLTGLGSLAELQNTNIYPLARRHAGQIAVLTNGVSYQLGNDLTTWTIYSKVNTTNGSATGLTVSNLTASNVSITGNLNSSGTVISSNALADIAEPFIGTTLYSFGTSHTAGGVAYPYATNYIASIGSIDAQYRYPYLLQQKYGFTTLNNNGASGTTLRFNTTDSTLESAHINRLGALLPINWTGTVTMDFGYNDGYQQYSGSSFAQPFVQAYRAVIARALSDYYVTAAGKDSSYNTYTWTTTGTPLQYSVQSYNNPFPTAGSDTNRISTQLTGTQNLSVTVNGWSNAVIFFDQNATGGQAIVFANSVQGPAITSYVPFVNVGSSGYTTDRLVGAVLLKELSGSTTISITNQYGTNSILAIARIPSSVANRSIIVDSPPISNGLLRDQGVLLQMGTYARAAVSEFAAWPVYFADVAKSINPLEHQIHPTLDPYHWNPSGQKEYADAFIRAKKPNPDSGYSWQRNRFANLVGSESVTIDGDSSNPKNLFYNIGGVTRFGIASSTSGDLYFQSYNSSGAFQDNNIIIGNTSGITGVGTITMSGGMVLRGTISSYPNAIPVGTVSVSGSTTYIDSVTQTGGSYAFNPMIMRGSTVSIDCPLQFTQPGYGLKIKEGSNAKMGTVNLVGGTATVANSSVAANSRIILTSQADSGITGYLRVSTRVAGTSFTIQSSSASDTSTVAWLIFDPAP